MNDKKYARDFGNKPCIIADWYEEGVRVLIANIRGSHFCQYFGIPIEHPLAGFDYDLLPLNCHGGLTFSSKAPKDSIYPEGFWWYGWDYAHSGDYTYYESMQNNPLFQKRDNEHDWTLEEVKEDGKFTLWDFQRLMKLAEKITQKAKETHVL